jgi:hypothetical protein
MLVVKAKNTPLPNMDDLGMEWFWPILEPVLFVGLIFEWDHLSSESQQRHISSTLLARTAAFKA